MNDMYKFKMPGCPGCGVSASYFDDNTEEYVYDDCECSSSSSEEEEPADNNKTSTSTKK